MLILCRKFYRPVYHFVVFVRHSVVLLSFLSRPIPRLQCHRYVADISHFQGKIQPNNPPRSLFKTNSSSFGSGSWRRFADRPGHYGRLHDGRSGLDVFLFPRFVHRPRGQIQMVEMLRPNTRMHSAHQLFVQLGRNHSRLFPVILIIFKLKFIHSN